MTPVRALVHSVEHIQQTVTHVGHNLGGLGVYGQVLSLYDVRVQGAFVLGVEGCDREGE